MVNTAESVLTAADSITLGSALKLWTAVEYTRTDSANDPDIIQKKPSAGRDPSLSDLLSVLFSIVRSHGKSVGELEVIRILDESSLL